MQEGLQFGVGFENARCDEDVVMADNFFGLLAYESEKSDLGHGRRRLSVVDGSKEGGGRSVGMFGMLGGSIDRLRVHERLSQGFELLEDVEDALLGWDRAILGPQHTAGKLLYALVDGVEVRR